MDIDQDARYVYTSNFAGNYLCCELGSVRANQLDEYQAELWWMSPPCTPFTQKGKRKDNSDSRTMALGHLIQLASRLSPRYLVIENVPGFEHSKPYKQLQSVLTQGGVTCFGGAQTKYARGLGLIPRRWLRVKRMFASEQRNKPREWKVEGRPSVWEKIALVGQQLKTMMILRSLAVSTLYFLPSTLYFSLTAVSPTAKRQ